MSKKKIKIELPTRTVVLENAVMLPGVMYNTPTAMGQKLMFVPDDPVDREGLKWEGNGKCFSMRDGTAEFIRKVRKKGKSTQLVHTEHGVLTKRCDGYMQVTITVADDGENKVKEIIKNEAAQIADALE